MKKIFGLLLIVLTFTACTNKKELSGDPPQRTYGYAEMAGVEFDFTYEMNTIEVTNTNDVVVKVDLVNKTTGQRLCSEMATLPFHTMTLTNRDVAPGDLVEFKIWRGPVSVFYADIHGLEPDFQGEAVLAADDFAITSTSTTNPWQVMLLNINGAACQFDGRYEENDPLAQTNSSFFCENVSANPIRVEVYTLKPRNGGGYETNFKLVSFWIALQNMEDISFIDYNFVANEPLAIRVTSFDPLNFNRMIYQDTMGLFLNVSSQSWTPIYSPIYLE